MQPSAALRMFRATPRMMKAAEKQPGPDSMMTKIKKVPVEIWPLAVVVGFACGAAGWSLCRKLWVDPTMRLKRQGPRGDDHH